MNIDKELLAILVCPENKTPVALIGDSLLQELNSKIDQGILKTRSGEAVKEKLEGGLIREDQRVVYPIRKGIPIMLIDERIEI